MAADPFLEEAGGAFLDELVDLDLGDVEKDVDAAELGRHAARVVASELLWRRQLGNLMDLDDVRQRLGGISRQAVHQRRSRGTLLALDDEQGKLHYPAFQFHQRAVVPRLGPVISALRGAVETQWTIASWLTSPQEGLDGHTPIEWLHQGRDAERVVRLARRTAERLSH